MARRSALTRSAPSRVSGPARVGPITKELVTILQPGDVAIIDHADLDRVAAESLVAAGVVAVVNAAASSTGRYPNEGPLILLDAGIVLIDQAGPEVMVTVDGSPVEIDGASISIGGVFQLVGTRLSRRAVEDAREAAAANMAPEFARFIGNTVSYLDDNLDLLSDEFEVPDLNVDFTDRHVLLVVRGHHYREDLALMRSSGYIREFKPLLVAVDGGADALLEMKLTPDLIVGDFDSVSERSLRCGAQLVVHGYRDGGAPGAERLERLGLDHLVFNASGTSEDIAMLLAYEHGAALIVAVGTHSSMVDFLDKGRRGMASTLVTRMKVGPILVDARGVSRLYRTKLGRFDVAVLIAAALLVLIVVALASEPIRLLLRAWWVELTY